MAGDPIIKADRSAFIIACEASAAQWVDENAKAALNVAKEIATAIGAPSIEFCDRGNGVPIIDNVLSHEIADSKRTSLVLVGGLLESAVTQVAIQALLDGFDVFICVDLVVTSDPQHKSIYLDRISALSGIAVTSRQIMLELLLQESDPNRRSALQSLRDRYIVNS